MNMNKITWPELCTAFHKHNDERGLGAGSQFADKQSLVGVVVFKNGPWFNQEYSEMERTYRFSSDNKFFISGMCGSSLFADCDDGVDKMVRLDNYLGRWEIDYCYIQEPRAEA